MEYIQYVSPLVPDWSDGWNGYIFTYLPTIPQANRRREGGVQRGRGVPGGVCNYSGQIARLQGRHERDQVFEIDIDPLHWLIFV